MKILTILLLLIIPGINSFGQELIKGSVISESGLPLAGATLKLKNAGVSTLSDSKGKFSLATSGRTDTLLVSFVGHAPQSLSINLPNTSPLLIVLKSVSRELEEVSVSTGYYQVPPERSTGSFTYIDQNTLERSNTSDILNRLKGVANGVLFDERNEREPKISVRGLSTIYANQAPLIVLNNFPYEGDINDINPNDVESISILKDAAAASIWGVRAANGVIVVTTKKGRVGQKPELGFNSFLTIGNKPDLNYNRGISSAEFIDAERFLFDRGFYNGMENDPARPALTPAVELFIAQRDGRISAAEANAQLAELAGRDVLTDFDNYIYQNSRNQQYAVNLRGGSEWNTYYFSAGYDHAINYTSSKYDRITLRADQVFSLGKFKIRPNVSYSTGKDIAGKPDLGSISPALNKGLYPYAQFADDEGRPVALTKDYRDSYVNNAENLGLLNWQYFPLEDYKSQEIRTDQNALILNMGIDYQFAPTLTAKVQYQYENSVNNYRNWARQDSYYTRNLINQFTQRNGTGPFSYEVPLGDILDLHSTSIASHGGRGQLEYNSAWGKHRLDALGGAEVRDIAVKGNVYRTYGFSDDGLSAVPVNYIDVFPTFQNPGNTMAVPNETDFTDQVNRYTAFYTNAAYTFDERYILSASARKDASNLFGVRSNQKGVPLWSAGLAWNIHHEKFFAIDWLDQLKLRLTYGFNGNLDRNLAALATIYQLTGNINNRPYGQMRSYPNPELSWEKIAVFNTGIDFGIQNSRITGSVDFYIKNGKNLIGDQPIDPTVGLLSGTIRRNIADMRTTGVDVQINSLNIDRKFKWNSSVLFSYNENRLTSYYNEIASSATTYLHGGNFIRPVEGKPVYSVFSLPWAGLNPTTGDPRGYLDGQVSTDYRGINTATSVDELVFHGAALPPVFGAFTNTFSYGAFSVYLNLTYKFGYFFRRRSVSYASLYNGWTGHADYTQRWQQPGDELNTNVPSRVYPAVTARDDFYLNSEVLIEKGDHVRLQDLNFSYRFGGKPLNLPLKGMVLFTNVRNLGFVWRANKQGLDPDYANSFLPPSFSISFGVRAGI